MRLVRVKFGALFERQKLYMCTCCNASIDENDLVMSVNILHP